MHKERKESAKTTDFVVISKRKKSQLTPTLTALAYVRMRVVHLIFICHILTSL